MTVHNREIANLFNRFATLLEIEGDNPFRIRAYRNAARTIEGLSREVSMMLAEGYDLSELPGIGEDLAGKIAQIVANDKFGELEALQKKVPAGLAELTAIPGLGPKRIKTLFEKLDISSVEDLKRAAHTGRLKGIRGFGPKFAQTVAKLTSQPQTEKRMLLADAERVAEPLAARLAAVPGVEEVVIAGSYRRRKETVGDLDILVLSDKSASVVASFVSDEDVTKVLARGTTKASIRLKCGLQVDLRVIAPESAGAALVYFTGSKAHNIAIRTLGRKKNLKFNEYGVFRGKRRLASKSEADVYAAVGLPLIPPELRENTGEVEAAQKGCLPHLVTLADMKGDLHVHTDASDGHASLVMMVEAAKALGYEYIAISDHASRIGIVHGLDARRLARQMANIDRLNGKLRGITVLKSVEVDIAADGSLALDDGILAELDLVTASIHSKFDLNPEKQTERLIRAMDHKTVTVIGHPTGRLIGERDAYALDMRRLLAGARERGCLMELNAQPNRLDLNDAHLRLCKEMGVKVVISTDAHSTDTLACMRFGVDQARRGWLEASDVANTRTLADFRKLLKRAH